MRAAPRARAALEFNGLSAVTSCDADEMMLALWASRRGCEVGGASAIRHGRCDSAPRARRRRGSPRPRPVREHLCGIVRMDDPPPVERLFIGHAEECHIVAIDEAAPAIFRVTHTATGALSTSCGTRPRPPEAVRPVRRSGPVKASAISQPRAIAHPTPVTGASHYRPCCASGAACRASRRPARSCPRPAPPQRLRRSSGPLDFHGRGREGAIDHGHLIGMDRKHATRGNPRGAASLQLSPSHSRSRKSPWIVSIGVTAAAAPVEGEGRGRP